MWEQNAWISFSGSSHKMSTMKCSSSPGQRSDVHRLFLFPSLSHATSSPTWSTRPQGSASTFPGFLLCSLGVSGISPLLARIRHCRDGARVICRGAKDLLRFAQNNFIPHSRNIPTEVATTLQLSLKRHASCSQDCGQARVVSNTFSTLCSLVAW